MKKRILVILLCLTVIFECVSCQKTEHIGESQEEAQTVLTREVPQSEETATKVLSAQGQDGQSAAEEYEYTPEGQMKANEQTFRDKAKTQGIDAQTTNICLQKLTKDNLFQDGKLALTGLRIDDIDGNGQTDMLIRVVDAQEKPYYGSGGLWFYMNDDVPYCFCEEQFPYWGDFDLFWEDIDNDENVEIIFWSQGIGVGATGDIYKAVFKYKNHAIEQMRLPSDLEGDVGFVVEVIQEAEPNSYTAYCPYFDERISFRAQNMEGHDLPEKAKRVGGNVRGFCDLRVAEYHGKKALQASEYLNGEGAVPHEVATAQFLITWKADGTPNVVEWWIDESTFRYANLQESRICYENGYYYYASQSDHYFLYRVKVDGSAPQCLVRAHCTDICALDGDVYFVNQSDRDSIYRLKAGAAEAERLCEYGHDLQVSGEYVYFFDDSYDAQYDAFGLAGDDASALTGNFLYRMNRDGSQRVLIATNVYDYVLSDVIYQNVRYVGAIYYSERTDEGITVCKMDLSGQNAEEVCHFTMNYFTNAAFSQCGRIAVMGEYICCIGFDDEGSCIIARYCLWNQEMKLFTVPKYTGGYTSGCFYRGAFYGICGQEDTQGQTQRIYKKDLDTGQIQYFDWQTETMRDLYGTGEGIFLRQLVSKQEGFRWFQLTEDGTAQELEDREQIPVTLPAREAEPTEAISVTLSLESTKGYEAYLEDDLEYEEYYKVNGDGKALNPYRIRLPQFNSKIAGYRKINQYFQNAYQEALQEREAFFQMLREEKEPEVTANLNQYTDYGSIYIGERYITVAKYEGGYWGGIRAWTAQSPVTFDRTSGEVVSLEDILGMPEQECAVMLTGSVYKYMEGIGNKWFSLDRNDSLMSKFDPTHFFVCSDGIGIHYERYAIDCGAAGDYLFVVPWGDFATLPQSPQ